MCNVAITTVLVYCIVTLLSLVTNKDYLLTYLLTWWSKGSDGRVSIRVWRQLQNWILSRRIWRRTFSVIIFYITYTENEKDRQ